MVGKQVDTEIRRKINRLLTINLSEEEREQVKAAYDGGFTNVRIDNNIKCDIVSRDTTCIYPRAGEGVR